MWILLPRDIRGDGIRKLQISNASFSCVKRSILLDFCKAKRTGFSNAVILRRFDCLAAIRPPNPLLRSYAIQNSKCRCWCRLRGSAPFISPLNWTEVGPNSDIFCWAVLLRRRPRGRSNGERLPWARTIRLQQLYQLLSLLCVFVIWGICFSLKANPNGTKNIAFWHTFGTGDAPARYSTLTLRIEPIVGPSVVQQFARQPSLIRRSVSPSRLFPFNAPHFLDSSQPIHAQWVESDVESVQARRPC